MVNPSDPAEILYLSERDYIVQIRVSMTQNQKLLTLATPNTARPDSASSEFKNSPPLGEGGDRERNPNNMDFDYGRAFRKVFSTKFHWIKFRNQDGEKPVSENMAVVTERNLLPLLDSWSYQLWSRIEGLKSSGKFRREVWVLCTHLCDLLRRHGVTVLISRMKIYLFVISSFVAGKRLENTHDLGLRVRLSHGLPKILPAAVRLRIRNRDPNTIRLWSSIFYMYKALTGPHKAPKFDVITSSAPVKEFHYLEMYPQFVEFANRFVEWLYSLTHINMWLKMDLTPKSLFSAASAGPNASWGLGGLPLDSIAWIKSGWKKGNPLKDFMEAVGDKDGESMFRAYLQKLLLSWYPVDHAHSLVNRLHSNEDIHESELWNVVNEQFIPPHILRKKGKGPAMLKSLELGKLAALPEAAGKVRIIAIVDCWTQTYLGPIHDFFFKVLSKIPTDATFDQQGAVSEFAKKGYKDLYSYDLTAATDMIPYTLYEAVMIPFFGETITKAWLSLLRSRDWLLPKWKVPGQKSGEQLLHRGSAYIRYNRGQPMGAKSSWGALALTHHALVQFAAFRHGMFPFLDYLVLGDDIVIANKYVADEYRIVAVSLGVKIGLAKSFTSSEGFFNFANQSFFNDINLSPISFKEELATTGITGRLESLWRAVARGWLSVSDSNFFARAVRWMVPPQTLKKVEEDRKSGVLGDVGKWCATAVFTSALAGHKAFEALEGLSIPDILSILIRPKLSLFTVAVAPYLTKKPSKNWLSVSGEYSLLVIDWLCRDIKVKLIEKGNLIRAVIGQNPTDELSEIVFCPPLLTIDRVALGLADDREKEHIAHPGTQPIYGLENHLEKIKMSRYRDIREWDYLSYELFGGPISLPRIMKVTDKVTIQMNSINPAIQFFSAQMVWDIATDLIPTYNKLVLQLQVCTYKMRHFLGTMPHLIPQMMPQELELLKWLQDSSETSFTVLSKEDRALGGHVIDRKIGDMQLLADKARYLGLLEHEARRKPKKV